MWRNKFRPHNSKSSKGFTLIEVLVAIAIFATLSVSAYQVLNQVQRSNAQSIEKTGRLKDIQRAMVIIDNDFRQMALRQFRTNGDEPSEKIIEWGQGLLESDNNAVLFVRLGWLNPQQMFPRGEVSKVGYRVVADRLERVWWRYPDTPVGQQGIVTPLLDGVTNIEMRFYSAGNWLERWDQPLALPEAVAFSIELQDYGKIERVYLTAGEKLQKDNGEGSSDEAS
ncbi:type II secretion system minor pseudopilin GspJ [Vibrio sp. SCSIO 43137]|uniref:type II secretion system minor pseudopilin GspJ n=1 Tax=Vibrio sp. SCSIO 43137 TaxID=3021011 RepID=UPI002307B00E|nr:type II secretion system minor pseudopilin GspJ [Vibrio sp. SCSIO 43137]WCE29806.1 type II secretion system minor pseudopilin GspJ [Vibrio sp. SCSIO 43137]